MLTPDMADASSRTSEGPTTKHQQAVSKENITISPHMSSTPRITILPEGWHQVSGLLCELEVWLTHQSEQHYGLT